MQVIHFMILDLENFLKSCKECIWGLVMVAHICNPS
jgi:hypothetical protein